MGDLPSSSQLPNEGESARDLIGLIGIGFDGFETTGWCDRRMETAAIGAYL
jgi:hypothetical protein